MARILIVDDEPVVLEVLARLLEAPGRDIVTAQSADVALGFSAAPLELALVDKNLQGASGLELAARLKALQPETEIILMTGYASIDSAIEAVKIGAFDYLTKPIDDYTGLELKVQNAVEKSALRRGQGALVRRLLENEVRYRSLVESAPDPILVYDKDTSRIEDANAAAVKLYGLEREELLKLRIDELRRSETRARDQVAEGGRRETHLHKSGRPIAVEVSATEFEFAGRTLQVLSARDVTERERQERERERLEERLRLAQKMDAIGRLAGGVAHDFNNLLSVVQAHTDFLYDVLAPDAPARAEVDGIARAAGRGAALTRQLLLFTRQKPLETGAVDANAVVSDVQKLLSRVLGENVRLVSSLSRPLRPVRADADQLAQVVLNLAVNARDALRGGGTIAVETANVDIAERREVQSGELSAGAYARITVRDDGDGMTAEVVSRLFEPFFTTKEFGKGTGLGLATVYGIVSTIGGAIEVESAPGKGSSFVVYLPATDEVDAPSQKHAPRAESGRGETILLVEDEEPLRALVRRILVAHGYLVLEGRDGADALQAAQAHGGPIHLLLTDVVMPQMGGRELATRLLEARPETRVLFMTGYTEHAVEQVGGAVSFLQKPFATPALLGQVRKLLDPS